MGWGNLAKIALFGNVGIGTTNPLLKLQVNVATNRNWGIEAFGGNPRLLAVNDANSALVQGHITANPLLLNSNGEGNVGIGTTNPTTALEVAGGLRLNTTASKPTCDATKRGTFWFEQSASGTDDFVYACMRDRSNAYKWVLLSRAGED